MHQRVEERIRGSRAADEEFVVPPTFSRSPRRKIEDNALNLTPEMKAKLKSYDIDTLKKLGINLSDLETNGDTDLTHCTIDPCTFSSSSPPSSSSSSSSSSSAESNFSVSLPSFHMGEHHHNIVHTNQHVLSSSSAPNLHNTIDRNHLEDHSHILSTSGETSGPRSPHSRPTSASASASASTSSDSIYLGSSAGDGHTDDLDDGPSSPHPHDGHDGVTDLNFLYSPRSHDPSASPQRVVSPRKKKEKTDKDREKGVVFSPRDKEKEKEKALKKNKKKLNIGSSAIKFMRTPRGNAGPTPRKTSRKGGSDEANAVETRIQQELLTMELLSGSVDELSLRVAISQGAVEKLISETYHPAKKKGIMIELLDDEEGRRESIAAVREFQKEKNEREKREKERPFSDSAPDSASSSSSSPFTVSPMTSFSSFDGVAPASPVRSLSPRTASLPSLLCATETPLLSPSSPPPSFSPVLSPSSPASPPLESTPSASES